MSIKKKLGFFLLIVILGIIYTQNQSWQKLTSPSPKSETKKEHLQIISTNPHPLDEATILPFQSIEITLNKPLFRSQLKHVFNPDIEHDVVVLEGRDQEFGSKFKIIFKKPLELGTGYSLLIQQSTHTEDGLSLDKEYIYHFKTIEYKGV